MRCVFSCALWVVCYAVRRVPWEEARGMMLKWSGYAIMAVQRQQST